MRFTNRLFVVTDVVAQCKRPILQARNIKNNFIFRFFNWLYGTELPIGIKTRRRSHHKVKAFLKAHLNGFFHQFQVIFTVRDSGVRNSRKNKRKANKKNFDIFHRLLLNGRRARDTRSCCLATGSFSYFGGGARLAPCRPKLSGNTFLSLK